MENWIESLGDSEEYKTNSKEFKNGEKKIIIATAFGRYDFPNIRCVILRILILLNPGIKKQVEQVGMKLILFADFVCESDSGFEEMLRTDTH